MAPGAGFGAIGDLRRHAAEAFPKRARRLASPPAPPCVVGPDQKHARCGENAIKEVHGKAARATDEPLPRARTGYYSGSGIKARTTSRTIAASETKTMRTISLFAAATPGLRRCLRRAPRSMQAIPRHRPRPRKSLPHDRHEGLTISADPISTSSGPRRNSARPIRFRPAFSRSRFSFDNETRPANPDRSDARFSWRSVRPAASGRMSIRSPQSKSPARSCIPRERPRREPAISAHRNSRKQGQEGRRAWPISCGRCRSMPTSCLPWA